MDIIVSNVACSLIASVIFDLCKNGIVNLYESKKNSRKSIEKKIKEELQNNYIELFDSGSFLHFLKSTYFQDVLEGYIIYKIQGNYAGCFIFEKEVLSDKKHRTSTGITEKEVIDYLTEQLLKEYDSKSLYVPTKEIAHRFFNDLISFIVKYISKKLGSGEKNLLFLVNRRLDYSFESMEKRFEELESILKRTIASEVVTQTDNYIDIVSDYHKILKTRHSEVHIHLLDKFDVKDFYVPPFLNVSRGKNDTATIKNISVSFPESIRTQYIIGEEIEPEDYDECEFDDWKYIFEMSNLIYVTGGAGYGKTLFLKKIINDYEQLKIMNCSDYLVIYGDLKSFYSNGQRPTSILKYLQNCMITESLMDESELSIELIDYYLKRGRCLILLDALDEVEKQKRETLHSTIISFFKNTNPNNKVVITSRDRAFIPAKNILVYEILPLKKVQIEKYVDNIIKLKKFDSENKEMFLEQTDKLVKKKFLNSFLVLSLMMSIYKSERELPENKLDLYKKCFEYMAVKREKPKTEIRWDLISSMMKENTFMELSRMCFPNNREVDKQSIVDMLCTTYSKKYSNEAETETAAEHFLSFCSDRTELFVPATEEDKYKFFHRSFFEYYYSQYIFLRMFKVKDIFDAFEKFGLDSEVFELTMAMLKQTNELKYQELMDYIFSVVEKEVKKGELNAFNILTLVMQVVDDVEYKSKYFNILAREKTLLVASISTLPNQRIIYEIVVNNKNVSAIVYETYEEMAKYLLLKLFLLRAYVVDTVRARDIKGSKRSVLLAREAFHKYNSICSCSFFCRLYDIRQIVETVTENELSAFLDKYETNRSIAKLIKFEYSRVGEIDQQTKEAAIYGMISR